MDRTHWTRLCTAAEGAYWAARNWQPPWANNPSQDRYRRRVDHSDPRIVFRMPGEARVLVLDLGCRCGRSVFDHRRLGGPHANPPGCTGWRPRRAPALPYYLCARLRIASVIYPPFVGWLRGRPNTWARRIVAAWPAYCDLDDAPYVLARPTLGELDAAADPATTR